MEDAQAVALDHVGGPEGDIVAADRDGVRAGDAEAGLRGAGDVVGLGAHPRHRADVL